MKVVSDYSSLWDCECSERQVNKLEDIICCLTPAVSWDLLDVPLRDIKVLFPATYTRSPWQQAEGRPGGF